MHRPARYNAKARGLHKKGKTNKRKCTNEPVPAEDAPAGLPSQTQAYADANADILERKSEEEKEADRRLKLRQQVRYYLDEGREVYCAKECCIDVGGEQLEGVE